MSQYDPNIDPNATIERIVVTEPVYTETVVVRRESSAGWWIAGGLAAAVLIAVLWILASGGRDDETEIALAQAQAEASRKLRQSDGMMSTCAIVTDPGATCEAGRCVLNKGIAPVM